LFILVSFIFISADVDSFRTGIVCAARCDGFKECRPDIYGGVDPNADGGLNGRNGGLFKRRSRTRSPITTTLLAQSNSISGVSGAGDGTTSSSASVIATSTTGTTRKQSGMLKVNSMMFLFYATLGSAMPYLPLYYHHLGISGQQIGFLGAITPAVTFFVSPLWGALADTTGKHKLVMLTTFIGSVLARSMLGCGSSNVYFLGIIVAMTAVLYAPVKPLLDAAVMNMLEDKSQYGKSRLFGQVGFGLGSFLVGPLLGVKIRSMFLVHAAMAFPTTLLMSTFRGKQQQQTSDSVSDSKNNSDNNSDNNSSNDNTSAGTTASAAARERKEKLRVKEALRMTLQCPKVLTFFVAVFVIGISSGIIENFAYMRIAEVSGEGRQALRVCRLLSSLAGGPMFWLSGNIINAIGTNAVLSISLLSYVLRFVIYAAIQQGWHAFPAEIMRGLTFAMFWAGSTCYVYSISPKGLSATMLGILNAMYGGLGQSIGALIGGAMVRHLGIAHTFYRCAAVDAALLVGLVAYQIGGYVRDKSQQEAEERAQMLQRQQEQQRKTLDRSSTIVTACASDVIETTAVTPSACDRLPIGDDDDDDDDAMTPATDSTLLVVKRKPEPDSSAVFVEVVGVSGVTSSGSRNDSTINSGSVDASSSTPLATAPAVAAVGTGNQNNNANTAAAGEGR